MTLSMEQFRERLVDYLYGELDAETRREFEACLVESAECRRELASFQSTLRTARQGLLPVDREAPPARVRTAVLAAAREAKHVSEPRVGAAPRRAHSERSGAWHWLRAPWMVPAFGVAAAVALLVLGRRIEPLRSHQADEREAATRAEPSSPGAVGTTPSEPEPAAKSSATAATSDEATPVAANKRLAKPSAAKGVPSSASGGGVRTPSKGFAEPPPSWLAERARRPAARRQEETGSSAQQPASLPDERRAAPAVADRAALAESEAPVAAAPAASAAAPPAPSVAPLLSLDALLRRAQEHLAARRFREAASDYRALLRGYPTDTRAPAWRNSLALATEAARDGGAAP